MSEIDDYKTRKRGGLTTDDVIEESQSVIKEHGAKGMIVIIQDEDDVIHRHNTEMNIVGLSGMLEVAKLLDLSE